MRALLGLSRGIDRLNTALGRLAAFLVLAAALISAGNAFIRYAFDTSSNAWLEIQWYLFGAIVLLGAAETLRRNEHVRVDLIYSNLSERRRLWVDVFGILLFLLPFTLVLAWLSWPVAWRSFVTGEGSTSAGGLIRWPFKMLLPLGFGLLALQGLSELVKRLAALRGLVALDTSYSKPEQ
ncbi:TRAP transporter small permease subunit [Rubellimicrobium aerolatum]|uniref:TRAP transporter small permease protein n=1 Tax=Rubellimicrobium aerolatum TaxID=490979 RepID=A0ABW0SB71_9RHOB|nr:TRAP transporter small permease subunit [Rubellimicrobium aerolatum]MBP1805482.1 TRAP-type mannitol/chloroaromatic compound transport system permease small subunit [Rubellimicrobium aerolatum]